MVMEGLKDECESNASKLLNTKPEIEVEVAELSDVTFRCCNFTVKPTYMSSANIA